MRPLFWLIAALIGITSGSPANAQRSPMTFRIEAYTMGIWWIVAEGEITPDTAARFDRFVAEQSDTDYLQGVKLNSSGGSLEAGLDLGRSIRRLRILTAVPGDGQCLSACAYAFLGGLNRVVQSPENLDQAADLNQQRLGFHSIYYDPGRTTGLAASDRDILAGRLSEDVQRITSRLSDYVASMGVSTDIVVRSSQIPSNRILFPTRAELTALRVVTDYDEDITEFQLIPDGAILLAVARHQSHQFTIACRQEARRRSPVIVFSQAVAARRDQLPTEIPIPIRLSAILALSPMPWTPRDLEHRHFHAHDAFMGVDFNPVFATFSIYYGDGEQESIQLDQSNSEFRVGGGFFHGLVRLTPELVERLTALEEVSLGFAEHYEPNWLHAFQNQPLERDMIRTALANCR